MRLITVAIHTYDHALKLRKALEREGIEVTLQNVNLDSPVVSSGMRVRIHERDLPLALRIIENPEVFSRESDADDNNERVILVPVDFSPHSYNAIRAAAFLAEEHKASMKLLHTYIDPVVAGKMQLTDSLTYELTDSASRARILADASAKMKKLSHRIQAEMRAGDIPAVKLDYIIVEGVPEDAISQYVKTDSPLLIVMGTRSFEKKEREMIGSVCAEVLDSCRHSVLVIPEKATFGEIKHRFRALFFANLDQEDILAYDTFRRVFPQSEAETTVVTIPGKRRLLERSRVDSPQSLTDYFTKQYTGSAFEVADITAAEALSDFDRLQLLHSYDLIVVPNKKKNMLSRVFNPGLAHRLLFHANIPMLVIPV